MTQQNNFWDTDEQEKLIGQDATKAEAMNKMAKVFEDMAKTHVQVEAHDQLMEWHDMAWVIKDLYVKHLIIDGTGPNSKDLTELLTAGIKEFWDVLVDEKLVQPRPMPTEPA